MADIKNTKNLCTVETDVVSDNTNFIVEDNKELKRVPKDQVIINSLTQLMANDTSNLLTGSAVSAQEILDVIADKVANKLLAKNQIINNLLATQTGNVLDATQGKVLMDKITQLNSELPKIVYLRDVGDIALLLSNINKEIVFFSLNGTDYSGSKPINDDSFIYGTGYAVLRYDSYIGEVGYVKNYKFVYNVKNKQFKWL